MEIGEKIGSVRPLHARASAVAGIHMKEMGASEYEHTIKVRKPYTITKQRERWTEEEHEKFLEAMKLYGRAWRQIEEHIGTKTAVQIRSHAQKFFSKVARQSSDDGASVVNAIEIPPPRPKKKPMRPYPRKMSQSSSIKMPVLELPDWSSSPIPSSPELEDRSPTSVLNAFRSDATGSSASNLPSSCTSPVSSAAESNQFGSLNGQENGCKLLNIYSEEESICPSSISTNVSMRKKLCMGSDMDEEKYATLEEEQPIGARGTSLKLFGRTVLVNDSRKPVSPSDESSSQCSKLPGTELDFQGQIKPILANAACGDFPLDLGGSHCGPWPAASPQLFFCLTPNGAPVRAATGVNIIPLPWCWPFYGGLQLPETSMQAAYSEDNPCRSSAEATDEKDNHQQDSRSSPNIAFGDDEVNPRSLKQKMRPEPSRLRQSANSAFSSLKPKQAALARGFVPYKRPIAEEEVQK